MFCRRKKFGLRQNETWEEVSVLAGSDVYFKWNMEGWTHKYMSRIVTMHMACMTLCMCDSSKHFSLQQTIIVKHGQWCKFQICTNSDAVVNRIWPEWQACTCGGTFRPQIYLSLGEFKNTIGMMNPWRSLWYVDVSKMKMDIFFHGRTIFISNPIIYLQYCTFRTDEVHCNLRE